MANVLTMFRREFQAYFDSSIAYIFMIVFLLASTWLFMAGFFLAAFARGVIEVVILVLGALLALLSGWRYRNEPGDGATVGPCVKNRVRA